MNKIIIAAAAALTVVAPVSALDIKVEAGSLAGQKVLLENTRDEQLRLTGTASNSDLDLLKEMSRTVKTLDLSGLSIIGNSLPEGMLLGSSVRSIVFPSGLTSIGASVFAGSAIERVAVPATVKEIGNGAFASCKSLTAVRIVAEATLGERLFKGSANLREVQFGYAIESIPASTFDGCASLESAVPPTAVTIGDYAYRGTPLIQLELENVEKIGDYAFANMDKLTEVTFTEGKEMEIGTGAFFGDGALASLDKFAGISSPLLLAHSGGGATLALHTPVVAAGEFAGNDRLEELTLGQEVSRLDEHAFRNAHNLRIIYVKELGSTPPEVHELTFSGLENELGNYDIELNVDKGTEDVWNGHPVWSRFNVIPGGSDVGSITDTSLNVAVTRNDDVVRVVSSLPIDYVALYTLDGITLTEAAPETERWESSVTPGEVVIVKIISHGKMKIVKLK